MAISEARKRANEKYNAKTYEQIAIRVPKGKRDEWKSAAEAESKSLAQFITDCINEHLASISD